MKYMLLMYTDEDKQPQTPEEYKAAMPLWGAFFDEINKAGVLIRNDGLSPVANASTVRVRDGKMLVTDGPFAETHEQLAGTYLVEVKDIDEALSWAAKIPMATYGSIEVRPLYGNP